MPGSTVLMKPNSSGKTLFADVILRAVGKAFGDDLKASSRRRQTENRSLANAARCSASVLSSSNSRSTLRNSLPSMRGCLKSPGRSRLTVRGPGFAPAVWKLEWETKSVKYDRIGTFQTPSKNLSDESLSAAR